MVRKELALRICGESQVLKAKIRMFGCRCNTGNTVFSKIIAEIWIHIRIVQTFPENLSKPYECTKNTDNNCCIHKELCVYKVKVDVGSRSSHPSLSCRAFKDLSDSESSCLIYQQSDNKKQCI